VDVLASPPFYGCWGSAGYSTVTHAAFCRQVSGDCYEEMG
jgi:hypothetical protein